MANSLRLNVVLISEFRQHTPTHTKSPLNTPPPPPPPSHQVVTASAITKVAIRKELPEIPELNKESQTFPRLLMVNNKMFL